MTLKKCIPLDTVLSVSGVDYEKDVYGTYILPRNLDNSLFLLGFQGIGNLDISNREHIEKFGHFDVSWT